MSLRRLFASRKALNNKDILQQVFFLAGGIAIIVQKAGNLSAFARNLKGVWDSSVGSGNQRWAG